MAINAVRWVGLVTSTLAVVAYGFLVFLGLAGWHDAAPDEPLLSGAHVLLVAGIAPLVVGLCFWLSAQTWRAFLTAIGIAVAFSIAHFMLAAYVAHQPRDQGTILMLLEAVLALGLVAVRVKRHLLWPSR